jgi:hypothetical protein
MEDISSIVNGPLFFNAAMIFSSVRIEGPGDSIVVFTATFLRRGEQQPCKGDCRIVLIMILFPRAWESRTT